MAQNERDPDKPSVNRRSFFRRLMYRSLDHVEQTGKIVADRVTSAVSGSDPPALMRPPAGPPIPVPAGPLVFLRPPGALPEDELADVCSRCGDCVRACPAQCIRIDIDHESHAGPITEVTPTPGSTPGPGTGLSPPTAPGSDAAGDGETAPVSGSPNAESPSSESHTVPRRTYEPFAGGLPYIVARHSPCVVCDELACMHVCPTGALRLVDRPQQIAMGTAEVDFDRCLRSSAQGSEDCRICVQHCPFGESAIGVDDEGRIDVRAGCTGCGVCEWSCPTEPASVVIKKGQELGPRSQERSNQGP